MSHVITRRDEDGTWFACSHENGVVRSWADHLQFNGPYSVAVFHSEAYAQRVAVITTASPGGDPDYICGPCKVRKL